ncbi:S-layer protein [Methanofollis aquaemaris]|uniref:S-layer protein n=1 Tax=Methanofollis aquaemaris TaxID=126734 RepID=A0A8A3S5G2_9EURY|nr:S-layer protein [Methanofollis aquaemaris]QSZ66864.1 S-layer protein [Methanofollis aquaemaris]
MPGDEGTITVTLTNTAKEAVRTSSDTSVGPGTGTQTETTSTAINAYVESVTLKGEGLQVLNGAYGRVGEVGPGQSVTLTFLVRAPVEEGIYFPEVWVRVQGARSVKFPVPVNVNSAYAVIKRPAITVARTFPDEVVPGESFSLALDLMNVGGAGARDLSVQVSPNDSLVSLTPEHYYFESLEPGEKVGLNLTFMTDRKTPTGVQQVPLALTYRAPDTTETNMTETVGVQVKGRAEMGIASLSTDPPRLAAGDPFTLIIRIENTGTDDANSVRATVDLPFEGNKEAFVGTIEPDNDAPAVFILRAGEAGDRPYRLTVTYRDDRGEHVAEEDLRLTVETRDRSGLLIAVVVLVVVAVGIIIWMRRRKNEEE